MTQLCSCMGYKSTCAVSLLEAETIGKYFVQFAKGETSMAGLSEITSEIIKKNISYAYFYIFFQETKDQ